MPAAPQFSIGNKVKALVVDDNAPGVLGTHQKEVQGIVAQIIPAFSYKITYYEGFDSYAQMVPEHFLTKASGGRRGTRKTRRSRK
jgi:hypothetical protein